MSVSFYLFCRETKQAVHVAEQSSRWSRGPDSGEAVGMFCSRHTGKSIECSDGDDLDISEYDLWTSAEEPERLVHAKDFAIWLKKVDAALRRCGKPASGTQNVAWFEMQFNAHIDPETVALMFGGETVPRT